MTKSELTPPAPETMREEIARVIDPVAAEMVGRRTSSRAYDNAIENEWANALAKADAILALLHSTPVAGGEGLADGASHPAPIEALREATAKLERLAAERRLDAHRTPNGSYAKGQFTGEAAAYAHAATLLTDGIDAGFKSPSREGWVTVPIEPTEAMVAASESALAEWRKTLDRDEAMRKRPTRAQVALSKADSVLRLVAASRDVIYDPDAPAHFTYADEDGSIHTKPLSVDDLYEPLSGGSYTQDGLDRDEPQTGE